MDIERKEARETDKEMTEGRRIADFVKSDDWQTVRGLFIKKIVELNDILNLGEDIEKLPSLIASRQQAIAVLMDFLSDVEGRAKSHEYNAEVLEETQETEIIQMFEKD